MTAPRPPADRAHGGPIIITLGARGPARADGSDGQVVEAELVRAPQEIGRQLGTEPLGEVIRRRQVTTRNGETAAILTSWFPGYLAEACPALLSQSPAEGDVTGFQPAWGEDGLSARPPTSAEAREFSIKRGSPVLVARSRRFDAADTVIEYAELIARADTRVEYRYEFKPA